MKQMKAEEEEQWRPSGTDSSPPLLAGSLPGLPERGWWDPMVGGRMVALSSQGGCVRGRGGSKAFLSSADDQVLPEIPWQRRGVDKAPRPLISRESRAVG